MWGAERGMGVRQYIAILVLAESGKERERGMGIREHIAVESLGEIGAQREENGRMTIYCH